MYIIVATEYSNSLPKPLIEWQNHAWQRFIEKAPDVVEQLTSEQVSLLTCAFALSDFVFDQLFSKPEWIIEILATDYTQVLPFSGMLSADIKACKSEEQLQQVLRYMRRKHLVGIAIGDLCHHTLLENSLLNLSNLSDTLIVGAKDWLSLHCQTLWGQPQNNHGEEQHLLVYAMGKLGGKELNFSSDIDLIFSYPEAGSTVGKRRSIDNQQYFTRLGQKLITALNQVTVDGFVFRVDMRLRPFGESGPLVMNFPSLENYYQDQGRDWERYAMLKARLVGDSEFHQQLQSMLRPFVYRRYIDFSVIDSFRRMKMMIAQEARRRQLQNNIKLGAGGIREIEFIAQVFQLIRGGRIRQLQERSLLKALNLLVEHDCITKDSKSVLTNAYYFLRRSENAIQAFNDQQTQELPQDEKNQLRLAHIMECNNWQDYLTVCQKHMHDVNQEFMQLIGEDSEQSQTADEFWVTYWHAKWDDEEHTQWILQQHPDWPAASIHKLFKYFKSDLKKRSMGQRGRQIVDKLLPVFIGLLGTYENPEVTTERTLLVLSKIVTRTAYLELLYENAPAFKQLIKLCTASEWIAKHLAKYPILLDELIDPKLLYAIGECRDYKKRISEALIRIPEDDLEAQMEGLRQFKQTQQLKVAAADITGILPVMEVSDHLTALAEAIIEEVVNMAWQQMVQRYGQPKATLGVDDKNFAVIGYGKLGGCELGYGSDLDMVFVHNNVQGDVTSGEKQISAMQFYLKLAQRILHLFNTKTASGILYEADMRLRPSGSSGAMVVHINTFAHYQQNEAWTWEHQALVRTRMICGDTSLFDSFNEIRNDILRKQRDHAELAMDVKKMREKMRNHLDKSKGEAIDIKQSTGGLADIEFIAQFMVLAHSEQVPELTEFSDNVGIFELLAEHQLISNDESKQLIDAYCGLRDLGHAKVLQNEENVISDVLMQAQRQQVKTIWVKYLVESI